MAALLANSVRRRIAVGCNAGTGVVRLGDQIDGDSMDAFQDPRCAMVCCPCVCLLFVPSPVPATCTLPFAGRLEMRATPARCTIGSRLQTPRPSRQFSRSRSALRGREGKSREAGCDHKVCRGNPRFRLYQGLDRARQTLGRRNTYFPAFSATISSRPLPSRYGSLSVELYKSRTANPHAENMRLNSAIV